MNLSRRKMLTGSASAAVAAFFANGAVFAAVEDITAAIETYAGGADVGEGVVMLTTPEIAENGNSVPVSVSVDSPMSAEDHVESIIILAEGNPRPDVATFHFTELSGEAKASIRMRLAKTQNIVAVAKMSDGSFHKVSNNVKVTIGGCGG